MTPARSIHARLPALLCLPDEALERPMRRHVTSPAPARSRRVRITTRLAGLIAVAGLVLAVQTLAQRSSDASIAWNIGLNMNWVGDGSDGTRATFLTNDGVNLNNCVGCDFALEVDIDGTRTTIAPGTTFSGGSPNANPLVLFRMDGIADGFAQGSYGQTFTATTTGTLTRARLNLTCLVTDTAPTDVVAGLFELNEAGDALVRQVADVPFPWNECVTAANWPEGKTWSAADFGWVAFPFNAPVTSGTRYAVLFTGTSVGGFQPSTELPGTSGTSLPEPTSASDPIADLIALAIEQASGSSGSSGVLVRRGMPVPLISTLASSGLGPRGDVVLTDAEETIAVTISSTRGVTARDGVIVPADGEIVCEVCALLAAGTTIEAWIYSEPRLAAAVRVPLDYDPDTFVCPLLRIPVGAPLDGGGTIPPGVHTLQLRMHTEDGFQVLSTGITIGGPTPTSVPTGEGPKPATVLLLLAGMLGLAYGVRTSLRTITIG